MSNASVATVRRLYTEVFNEGRLETADELVSPAFVAHGGPVDGTGPDFFKAAATRLRNAVSGMRFEVRDVFADGDRIAARWVMTGTHTGDSLGIPPTGEPITREGIVIFRTDEHGLAEQWAKIGPA